MQGYADCSKVTTDQKLFAYAGEVKASLIATLLNNQNNKF